MKSNREHLKKIGAYFAGHLTPAERLDLELWTKSSIENEMLFKEARKIWENSGLKLQLKVTTDTTDADWLNLKHRLNENKGSARIISFFTQPNALKIAASVILLLGVTYLFIQPSPTASSLHATVLNADKKMISFYLPDSTRVWLNAHSTLTYNNEYSKTTRLVQLDGDAYFDVAHNEKTPFMVTTTDTYTRVVGTSFSIHEDSLETILTVAKGTVSFASNANRKNYIMVEAKEKAVCINGTVKKYSDKNSKFSHWIQKDNPVFENEKLHPVSYLKTDYRWRKNAIHQSIVEGTVKSIASLAAYQNILLKISYTRANGKQKIINITVPGPVAPSGVIHFRKKLHDALSSTRSVVVSVVSAEAKPSL